MMQVQTIPPFLLSLNNGAFKSRLIWAEPKYILELTQNLNMPPANTPPKGISRDLTVLIWSCQNPTILYPSPFHLLQDPNS